jgi:RNA polymerase sigma-70 factor (ECF subfamily)
MDEKVSELQQLIAGCKRKDPHARKKLYEQYAPAMLGVCARYANAKDEARDIMQEGFIKVYTKIDSYSGSGSFEGWMRKVFITTALEYLRDVKMFNLHVDLDYSTEIADNVAVSTIEILSAEEILQLINELPVGFKTVFNLYAIEGYSHAEIARMLHIREGTSRSQFVRARQLLQIKIQNMYS